MKSLIVWARVTLWAYVITVGICAIVSYMAWHIPQVTDPVASCGMPEIAHIRSRNCLQDLLYTIDYLAVVLPHDVRVRSICWNTQDMICVLESSDRQALMNFDRTRRLYESHADGIHIQLQGMIPGSAANKLHEAHYKVVEATHGYH